MPIGTIFRRKKKNGQISLSNSAWSILEKANHAPEETSELYCEPQSVLSNLPNDIVAEETYKSTKTVPVEAVEYICLHEYKARQDLELSFRQLDRLEVLKGASDAEWWLARHPITGQQGMVPSSYLARSKNMKAEPWYFGNVDRAEAERHLLSDCNKHAAFLVRDSGTRHGEFTLSVRDGDNVKHYRIRARDGRWLHVTPTQIFPSLHKLIAFHRSSSAGLCCHLGEPCAKIVEAVSEILPVESFSMYQLPREQFRMDRRLGSGQFGEVWSAIWNQTVPVAMKMLRPGCMEAEEFLAEAQVLKAMRHPQLLQMFGVCTLTEPYYIVMELMAKGSLLEYLRSPSGNALCLPDLLNIGAQVASGMAYLEARNFIHRDLAARNVLVGENNCVKVADFGLSRLVKEDEYLAHAGAKFPIKWTAPEALNFNRFTCKSDVWSFGVLLMEIVTYGATPYPGMSNAEVALEVDRGYRLPHPSSHSSQCPIQLYNIMLQCWHRHPHSRPSFEELQWRLEEFFISV